MRFFIAIALMAFPLIFGCTAATAQSGPVFTFAQPRGPHAVGLKVVHQYDYSRTYRLVTDNMGKPYRGERARPLQMLVWYPAENSNRPAMTVKNYADLYVSETDFSATTLTADAKIWIATMGPTLASTLWAVRDAAPLSGRYPVIIYAPSLNSQSWENADLCEHLASHGYVVLASPDMGATGRYMTHDVAGINAEAQDISFLIGYAQTLTNTDISKVALGGYSWGGLATLFAAARDNRIDALFALDGSMRYYPGLIKEAGDIHPESMTIPMIYFTSRDRTLEELAKASMFFDGPNVLNAWTHGDLITIDMEGMVHQEFSSFLQRREDAWKALPLNLKAAGYERSDGTTGYAWMAAYTLHFLDAYLKHDAAAMAYLKRTSVENGAPKHFFEATFRPAEGRVASFSELRLQAGQQSYNHIADLYATMQKANPSFKVEEEAIENWEYELMYEDHLAEAISVAEWDVTLSPTARAYALLGTAYRDAGNKAKAIDAYKTSLAKNPKNMLIKSYLDELEGASQSSR